MKPRRVLLVCAVGLALAACGALVVQSDDAVTPYDRGRAYFAEANYGRAVEQFQLVLSVEPGSVAALNGLGASYDQLGRFDLAERHYKRALSIAPDAAQTLNNLGVSYLMQGRTDLAAVFLGEARRLDDADPNIAANLGAATAAADGAASPTAAADGGATPVTTRTRPILQKPIRRQTAALQRLFTKVAAVVPMPRARPVPGTAPDLSIELTMLDTAPTPSLVKGDESPKPYSSLTIEIGESVGAL